MLPTDTNLSSVSKLQECNKEIPECLAEHQLFIVLAPILFISATVGNSLGLAVMLRKSLRQTATAVLIACLAVSDMIAVWTGLSRHFILKLTGENVRERSTLSCQFQRFFLYLSLDTSAWILVAITIERFLAVCLPTKHYYFKTAKQAGCAVLAIVASQIIFNAHVFWTRGEQTITENNQTRTTYCGYPKPAYEYYWDNHQPWLSMVVYSLLPATIMIILNGLIIRRLWKIYNTAKSYSNNQEVQQRRANQTISMTKMLLAATFYFILVTTPIFLYKIIEGKILYRATKAPSDEVKACWQLIYGILTCFLYANHSVNFLLYFLSGRKFRRELSQMLRKVFPCRESCQLKRNQPQKMSSLAGKSITEPLSLN